MRLESGKYMFIDDDFVVQVSEDMQNWQAVGRVVESAYSGATRVYRFHVNSLTEIRLDGETTRIFLPLNTINASGAANGSELYYSDDQGATWQLAQTKISDVYPNFNSSTEWGESKILAGGDGILRWYEVRTKVGCAQYLESTDNGMTWRGPYQVPEIQAPRTSFAVYTDPSDRVSYIVWVNSITRGGLGNTLDRVRLSMARSFDGKNWEFLMDIDRMQSAAIDMANPVYQFLDPSLLITDDYIYVTYGRSDHIAMGSSHNYLSQQLVRIDKSKLPEALPWDGYTLADSSSAKTAELLSPPKLSYALNEAFSADGGVVRITGFNGDEQILDLSELAIDAVPDTTAEGDCTVVYRNINLIPVAFDIHVGETAKETALFISADGEAGAVSARADYVPGDGDPAGVALLLALYAADGRLLDLAQASAAAAPYELGVSLDRGEAAYAKAFLWDSATHVPVAAAKELALE
jgi:hypothetical protein